MTVYVCPEKDIECGSNVTRWCDSCPQHSNVPTLRKMTKGCSLCGIAGPHACPGAPIPEWTPEAKAHLNEVLSQYPPIKPTMLAGFRFIEDPTMQPNTMRVVQPDGPNISAGAGGKLTFADIERAKQRLLNPSPIEIPDPTLMRSICLQAIRTVLSDSDQDGVLAKIRQIVNACP